MHEQPIPADEIKPFYVLQLELQVDQAEIDKASRALQVRANALQRQFAALFADRALDMAAYRVNLKTGKMTPAEAAPPETPPDAPQAPEPPQEGTSGG